MAGFALVGLVLVLAVVIVIDGAVLSRGDAATEQLPPSQRGLVPSTMLPSTTTPTSPTTEPTQTDPPPVPDSETGAATSGERFSELKCTFESLNAFNGVTAGTGTIDWTEVARDQRVAGDLTPSSNTTIEIQLDYPVIVVWTTILDGPYRDFRGRLVLRDWTQVHDDMGAISGIRFGTTTTKFAPI